MTYRFWLCVAIAFATTLPLTAQDKPVEKQAEKQIEEEKEAKPWTFEGSIEWVSAYIFRGYNNVDTGWIVQPSFTIMRSFELNGDLSLDVYAGTWASFSRDTPGVNSPSDFNEIDVNFGVEMPIQKFTIALDYQLYLSPANDFDQVQELGLVLTYDDWLAPGAKLYKEFQDRNGSSDWYFELSIQPIVWTWEKLEISIPVYLGMSLDGFYTDDDGDNEFFGFAMAGLAASYALNDNWSVYGSVEYYQMFADSVEDANSGDDYKIVGRIGVAFEY